MPERRRYGTELRGCGSTRPGSGGRRRLRCGILDAGLSFDLSPALRSGLCVGVSAVAVAFFLREVAQQESRIQLGAWQKTASTQTLGKQDLKPRRCCLRAARRDWTGIGAGCAGELREFHDFLSFANLSIQMHHNVLWECKSLARSPLRQLRNPASGGGSASWPAPAGGKGCERRPKL